MKDNIFFYFNSNFRTFFFKDPDPEFSGSNPDFLADPDSEKKADPDTILKKLF